jgi:hypothetical protein
MLGIFGKKYRSDPKCGLHAAAFGLNRLSHLHRIIWRVAIEEPLCET